MSDDVIRGSGSVSVYIFVLRHPREVITHNFQLIYLCTLTFRE